MQCPGQDTRFWKPDAVFDVPCEACGTQVEFFKTDVRRRCPQCGKRIQNPRISLGCARWCSYARECLGFDPKALQLADSADVSLTDRLVQAVKAEFGADQARITHSLLVLDQAQDLLRREGGDPRVVMAAAVLHDIGIPEAARRHGAAAGAHHEAEGAPVARRIMAELGFDEESMDRVCAIVGSHHSGGAADTVEFRIVWDADRLLEMPQDPEGQDVERLSRMAERLFRTESGRQKAQAALADRARRQRSQQSGTPTGH